MATLRIHMSCAKKIGTSIINTKAEIVNPMCLVAATYMGNSGCTAMPNNTSPISKPAMTKVDTLNSISQ